MAAFRRKDVCRLYISMNDTLGMRRIECVRNLNRESEQRIRLDRFPGNPVLQCHPLQILHCNEGLVTMLADFVNRADVGMVEGRAARASGENVQR